MQSFELNGLDALMRRWESTMASYPEEKRKLMDCIGKDLHEELLRNLSRSGMRNGGGHLRGWQRYHVGSKNGYVALRAKGTEAGHRPGKNSPGAITNYTENGHRVRPPNYSRTRSARYQPRIKVAAVRGYHYYAKTESTALEVALERIRIFAASLARDLDGAA